MDKRLIILGGISIVLIGGAFFIGSTQAKTTLNDTVVTIKTAEEKKSSLQQDIENAEKTLNDLKKDSEDKRDELAETKQMISQKDSLTKEIDTLSSDIKLKKENITTLDEDIENKNKEVERLEKGIVELKAKPKDLPAGDFSVGVDIDAGRYRVTPRNGSIGSFSVNDGRIASVLLGNDSYSVKEYIVTLLDGDRINQTLPVTFQAVE